jgi:hypothetical protein
VFGFESNSAWKIPKLLGRLCRNSNFFAKITFSLWSCELLRPSHQPSWQGTTKQDKKTPFSARRYLFFQTTDRQTARTRYK